MLKKILLGIACFILLLVGIEVVRLLQLRASITSYAQYWQQRKAVPGQFTYVALGDSTGQGIGASKPQYGYVGLLAGQIAGATHESVRVVNLSVSGAKIEDVIQTQLPQLKNYHANLITVEIGANNVTDYNPTTFRSQYDALAQALPPGTVLANIPYFGGRIRDNAEALSASTIIAEAGQANHLQVVDLQAATHQGQSILNYGADFFHPSDRGYRIWAAAFWKIIQPDLPH
jgi:lysophospholipase L1-like esterase